MVSAVWSLVAKTSGHFYPFYMDAVKRVEPESNSVQSELVRSHDVTKPSMERTPHWDGLQCCAPSMTKTLTRCTRKATATVCPYICSHALPPVLVAQGGVKLTLCKVSRKLPIVALFQQTLRHSIFEICLENLGGHSTTLHPQCHSWSSPLPGIELVCHSQVRLLPQDSERSLLVLDLVTGAQQDHFLFSGHLAYHQGFPNWSRYCYQHL